MKITDFPKIQSPMKKAHVASLKSSYPRYMVGAVIVLNGKIIASGSSQEKTHPFIDSHGSYQNRDGWHVAKNMHAEIAAIFRVKNRESLVGATMYVYRQNKEGILAMSRPCPMCYKMLQKYGFKKMVYSTDGGFNEEYIE